MLKQRVITAVFLIPLVLIILFYSTPRAFGFFTALLALGGAWEWSNLMGIKNIVARMLYVAFIFILMLLSTPIFIPTILFITFIWWCFASVLVALYPSASQWWSKTWFWRGAMGIAVLVPCWIAMNFIRAQSDGTLALLFLLLLIWGADSAAYFVGKKWGKHKLAPSVSPGKSLQGLLGALLFAVCFSMVVLFYTKAPMNMWIWGIGLSLVTVFFSVLGDLFESMLKRQVGIKDSGRLLPGHGGLLDRIDSLTAAAPVFAYCAWILGKILD